MRCPTMWYVRPAKPQISTHIQAVWSEPLLASLIRAFASQSDQSLCWPPDHSMSFKLLTEHHLEFPSLKGGQFETVHVKMPHCWK